MPPAVDLAAAAAATRSGPETDDTGAGGLPAKWKFDLHHVDRRGAIWSGAFQCHVLTIEDRGRIGLIRARLLGGLSAAVVDAETLDLYEMIAHLTVALDVSPPWAKNIMSIRDVQVLSAIYKEVAAHEANFWGADAGGAGEVPNG